MNNNRIYYTLLLHVLKDKYEIFNEYEDRVLPLLSKYSGKLELRLKTDKSDSDKDKPDEIHIISFASEADFESYLNDKERKKYRHLFESSVERTTLIKGKNLINI